MKIRVTEYNTDKEFSRSAVVNFECKDADYRIYISNSGDSITITKLGKTDDQITVIPEVSNKIKVQ